MTGWGRGLSRLAITVSLSLAILAQPLAASVAAPKQAQALGLTGGPSTGVFFSATGMSVSGDFLSTFQRYGLERVGYPLTEERVENGQTVQYFERVRMERHPDLASKGYGVLLTRLGVDLNGGDPFAKVAPFKSTSKKVYIPQTGQSLSEPFLSYWRNNGGVEFFGYPFSEPMNQDGMYVQWFERARMEYHPDLAKSGKPVQLSLLGRAALGSNAPQAQTVAAQKQPQPAAPAVQLSDKESYMLKAINEQRAAAGLSPVALSAVATDVARVRSNDMSQRNYFSHTTPENTNFINLLTDRKVGYKYAGEILARNNYPSGEAAQVAMQTYLDSEPHKAVILNARYNAVGIGYSFSQEDEMSYFAIIFLEQ